MTSRAKATEALCDALRAQLNGDRTHAPEGLAILWNAFMALSRGRSCGPVGPNPISYPEIAAWCCLMRVPLEPHHVATLTAMDAVFMEHTYRRRNAPDGTKALPHSSGQALTPAMFDLSVG